MTTTPSPFRELVGEDAEREDRTAAWHMAQAERYAVEAAAQTAALIDRNGGSANPPHALRFAEMHAQLAIAALAVEAAR